MARPKSSSERVARAKVLGAHMRSLRDATGLSREALGRAAGVSTETVRKIEYGTTLSPELFTFAKIARQLGASVDAILVDIGMDDALFDT